MFMFYNIIQNLNLRAAIFCVNNHLEIIMYSVIQQESKKVNVCNSNYVVITIMLYCGY